MEGPATTSALIHAATLVLSGHFLLSIFCANFIRGSEVLLILVILSTDISNIAAAVKSLETSDVKALIASSTLGQMSLAIRILVFDFSSSLN